MNEPFLERSYWKVILYWIRKNFQAAVEFCSVISRSPWRWWWGWNFVTFVVPTLHTALVNHRGGAIELQRLLGGIYSFWKTIQSGGICWGESSSACQRNATRLIYSSWKWWCVANRGHSLAWASPAGHWEFGKCCSRNLCEVSCPNVACAVICFQFKIMAWMVILTVYLLLFLVTQAEM